ncbi:FAD dependent oxidoreductase [Aliiruegeria haliotis]|uniref:FAD dependent oxidoreductase n=1 Tax=Aliiruegeria haliotis TaxID=1280846 RepID=A0A2T0RMB0_9RHOB|nr:FAD-dependent oxidoreductase [Aliiruegeria haliotis]PRY22271.1 FAD dependent oxidoreductase [Aliiruegeria haliotis]
MIIEPPSGPRELRLEQLSADLVVVGGGLSGVCAAISAARGGSRVVLIQDRPVLGGNASSEVRLWILGATSHGGNNNRWAREGGIVNEVLLENQYRNPGGNPVILDTILQDWVAREKNLTVLVNTQVFHVEMERERIRRVQAFNSQNSTMYQVEGALFADSSGDGILVHMSGAAYRMGSEEASEFDEPMAPGDDYGKLLGHSMYFYTKDVGHRIDYVAPDFALKDVPSLIPRFRSFNAVEHGCSLWWIEWGGRLDTIHQSEEIKGELQKVVYGVWNYIKNSGSFPEAENLALEWVATIPGKRESRRAEGDYVLRQSDIIDQVEHEDNVTHGGWSIDLHPADGVYAQQGGCNQYHAKGVFGIPYRCMYSRNIENLFINGRLLSASHVAFGSTRVMATSGAVGQAIGTAASVCTRLGRAPQELSSDDGLAALKSALAEAGHHVPGYAPLAVGNLATGAALNVSSELFLDGLPPDAGWRPLSDSYAQMLPMRPGEGGSLTIPVRAERATSLAVEVRAAEKPGNHTPERVLQRQEFALAPGQGEIVVALPDTEQPCYGFLCLLENPDVAVGLSQQRVTGFLSVKQGGLDKVSTASRQEAPEGLGVESFDFWIPERRPKGQNIAFSANRPVHAFGKAALVSGPTRPTSAPNAWAAALTDAEPWITLDWQDGISARELVLYLDCDFDHPLESVQMRHADRVMPFLVHECEVECDGNVIAAIQDNRSPILRIALLEDETIHRLTIRPRNRQGCPVALFGIRVQ